MQVQLQVFLQVQKNEKNMISKTFFGIEKKKIEKKISKKFFEIVFFSKKRTCKNTCNCTCNCTCNFQTSIKSYNYLFKWFIIVGYINIYFLFEIKKNKKILKKLAILFIVEKIFYKYLF